MVWLKGIIGFGRPLHTVLWDKANLDKRMINIAALNSVKADVVEDVKAFATCYF